MRVVGAFEVGLVGKDVCVASSMCLYVGGGYCARTKLVHFLSWVLLNVLSPVSPNSTAYMVYTNGMLRIASSRYSTQVDYNEVSRRPRPGRYRGVGSCCHYFLFGRLQRAI